MVEVCGVFGDYAKIEWKVEVTMSSIWMKKVLRPMILMVFHTKQGKKKSVYLDVYQFQDLRKNVSLMLKNIHQIESK